MRNTPDYRNGLTEKVVVITGATSGVGKATALAFAREGAQLVLAARQVQVLEELVVACRDLGALAVAVPTDVTDVTAVKELAAAAILFGGHIDVWFNNAGVLAAGPFTETPVEIHKRVIRTNLEGYLHGSHAVLPYFIEQGYGVLINNISVGGWFPTPFAPAYTASKFGLRGLSESLQAEFHKYPDIHICDLFPAFLDTPGIQHAANYTGHAIRPAPPVYDPEKVADAVVRLSKDPRKSKTIGSVALLLRFCHFMLPALSGRITAAVIRKYLQQAPAAALTTGNLFGPADKNTGIHGGWRSTAPVNRNLVAGVMIAGMVAGWFLLKRKIFN